MELFILINSLGSAVAPHFLSFSTASYGNEPCLENLHIREHNFPTKAYLDPSYACSNKEIKSSFDDAGW